MKCMREVDIGREYIYQGELDTSVEKRVQSRSTRPGLGPWAGRSFHAGPRDVPILATLRMVLDRVEAESGCTSEDCIHGGMVQIMYDNDTPTNPPT